MKSPYIMSKWPDADLFLPVCLFCLVVTTTALFLKYFKLCKLTLYMTMTLPTRKDYRDKKGLELRYNKTLFWLAKAASLVHTGAGGRPSTSSTILEALHLYDARETTAKACLGPNNSGISLLCSMRLLLKLVLPHCRLV